MPEKMETPPSTGKSSNSSSSSNAAAGFWSLGGVVEVSGFVAFEAGAAPDAGAADILREEECEGKRDRGPVKDVSAFWMDGGLVCEFLVIDTAVLEAVDAGLEMYLAAVLLVTVRG
jgi:hypothetical protein